MLALLALTAGAAVTTLTTVMPAAVAFDAEHQVVALVDLAESEGSSPALAAARKGLMRSPRFELATTDADLDIELRTVGVHSYVSTVKRTKRNGDVCYTGRRNTWMKQFWVVTDRQGNELYDVFLRDETNYTTALCYANRYVARLSAGSRSTHVDELARDLGQMLSRKVSPYQTEAVRGWYAGDTFELRSAGRRALAGDWEEAERQWSAMLDYPYPPLALAKARLNLSVAAEKRGDMEAARQLVSARHGMLRGVMKVRTAQLDQRLADDKRLREQGVEL